MSRCRSETQLEHSAQRLALARAAASASRRLWPALWPALAVLGVFLVVSLLGLWALLPGWLHALGLAALAAGLVLDAVAGARSACAGPSQTTGLRRLERVNALPHQPLRSLGDRLSGGGDDPATRSLWRRHQERLRRRCARLRVGPPRSDLPRRDPWALRAALLLLLRGGAGRGRRHGARSACSRPSSCDRADPRRRGPGRADLVGHAAALHRPAAGPARGRARRAGRAEVVRDPGAAVEPAGRQRGARPAASSRRRRRRSFALEPRRAGRAVRRDRRGQRRGQPGDRALGPAARRQPRARSSASGRSRRSPTRRRRSRSPSRRSATHRGVLRSQLHRRATTTASPASRC